MGCFSRQECQDTEILVVSSETDEVQALGVLEAFVSLVLQDEAVTALLLQWQWLHATRESSWGMTSWSKWKNLSIVSRSRSAEWDALKCLCAKDSSQHRRRNPVLGRAEFGNKRVRLSYDQGTVRETTGAELNTWVEAEYS